MSYPELGSVVAEAAALVASVRPAARSADSRASLCGRCIETPPERTSQSLSHISPNEKGLFRVRFRSRAVRADEGERLLHQPLPPPAVPERDRHPLLHE